MTENFMKTLKRIHNNLIGKFFVLDCNLVCNYIIVSSSQKLKQKCCLLSLTFNDILNFKPFSDFQSKHEILFWFGLVVM
jgi:hypothetical protein